MDGAIRLWLVGGLHAELVAQRRVFEMLMHALAPGRPHVVLLTGNSGTHIGSCRGGTTERVGRATVLAAAACVDVSCSDEHVGSQALLSVLGTRKPALVLCCHIRAAAGPGWTPNRTPVYNAGTPRMRGPPRLLTDGTDQGPPLEGVFATVIALQREPIEVVATRVFAPPGGAAWQGRTTLSPPERSA